MVEISEADLANGRQDGYYEVFRAIGNGLDVSGKSINSSGKAWSDIARSGMTISEAAQSDSNCFSQWCAGQGVGTPYEARMNAQNLDALLSGSAPSPLPGTGFFWKIPAGDVYSDVAEAFRTNWNMPAASRAVFERVAGGQLPGGLPAQAPGTCPGLEGSQAYFADYFAEGVEERQMIRIPIHRKRTLRCALS